MNVGSKIRCETKMKKVNEEREKQPVVAADGEDKTKARKRAIKEDETVKPAKKSIPPAKKAKTSDNGPVPAAPAPTKPVVVPQAPTDPSRHARTVFISNLDYNFTEDDIRTAMSTSGTITEIRLIRDYKQRSKGYCYVEFSNEVILFDQVLRQSFVLSKTKVQSVNRRKQELH